MSARDYGTKHYSMPDAKRKRPGVELSLPRDKVARWRELAAAAGLSLSAWIERAADAQAVTDEREQAP